MADTPGGIAGLTLPPDVAARLAEADRNGCDSSRAGCTGQTGMPGVRDTKNPCDMFSPGKPTNGGCQGDGHYLCGKCVLLETREPLTDITGCDV